MKHMVFGFLTGTIMILFIILLLTFQYKNVRREELEQGLAEAMEFTMQTWKEACEDKDRAPLEKEELSTQLIQALSMQLQSDAVLTVNILASDEKKGLLSVEVIEEFRYPGGQTGRIKSNRTILADEVIEETTEKAMHTVTFFLTKDDLQRGTNIYKQCRIQHGDLPVCPKEPETEMAEFKEWRDSNDYLSDFSQAVESDCAYYAVFE